MSRFQNGSNTLTPSLSENAENDILESYKLHANCYIRKPVDLEQFMAVVKSVEEFWFTIVRLPPR